MAAGELQRIAIERRAKVEEFQRKHRAGLLTLLFTDIVDSTKLKQSLGDREAVTVIQRHHAVIREILGHFSEGEEIETAGDSFFIVFTKPRMLCSTTLTMSGSRKASIQDALDAYRQALAIVKRLAEQDKSDSGWRAVPGRGEEVAVDG